MSPIGVHSDQIPFSLLLGKLSHSSRQNLPNEYNSNLGFHSRMEITRETQLAEIDANLKRFRITQNHLESETKITVGTIKHLRKGGKRPLDAGKWGKICRFFEELSKQDLNNPEKITPSPHEEGNI